MRYTLGESLADFGFHFLEKLHEPIFLINKRGKLVKVNEAGRKFLRVTRFSDEEIEQFVSKSVLTSFKRTSEDEEFRRLNLGNQSQVIARSVGSDFVLIEVKK